mgnify:CR=1 FL=1
MFLIGDPKQAIYGFRGADVHTYLRARDELGIAVLLVGEPFGATEAAALALVRRVREALPPEQR